MKTPAEYVADIIEPWCLDLGYTVFVNHLPDKPDKAVVVYDRDTGSTEPRLARSGEIDEHPAVMIRVRGTDFSAAVVLPTLWRDVFKSLYFREIDNGKVMQCISKANTMGTLGHEPQTRRTGFTQQFRMTII